VRAPDADDLLRRLGRGVRPIGGAARSRVGADTPDFTMLLSGARSGAYRSGRRVGVPERFDIELSDEQREELDRAGDEAEAGGLGVFAAVVADRIVGKPYLEIDIDREAITVGLEAWPDSDDS